MHLDNETQRMVLTMCFIMGASRKSNVYVLCFFVAGIFGLLEVSELNQRISLAGDAFQKRRTSFICGLCL